MLPQWRYYSAEFLSASVTALKEKVSWQQGAKGNHKVALQITNLTQELHLGRYKRKLSLLQSEVTRIWQEVDLYRVC